MLERFRRRKNAPRQDWKPNPVLRVLYAVWRVAFGGFKIALGAAATVAMIVAICGFVFVGVLGDYLQEDILPMADFSFDDHELEQNSSMYYIDNNGQIQEYQRIFATTSSSWANIEDIPEDMIHAAIAIEDHRFYEHQGVDWITTIKACARMFFGDDSVGGSSITQQLIKNVLLTEDQSADDVTVQRKVLEIFRAVQVEKKYSKDDIMELYLNFIYLGQGCRGVRSAAAAYYGKELESLTTAECASIISITNSPTWYDPYQNPENNKERKEDVLWAMREYGWLEEEEYQAALDQELVLKYGIDLPDTMAFCEEEACGYKGIVSSLKFENEKYFCPDCGAEIPVTESKSQSNYSWFADTVLEDVAKALAEQNNMTWNSATKAMCMQQIQKGGYHIYTTIDVEVQEQVDKIYTDLTQIPEARSGQQLQSAIVVIDNSTGDIVAMAGGVGEKTGFDDWNRATDSDLQSGSSIKPLSIYAPGFEQGTLTPATVVKDLPLTYSNGHWPRNDNYKYSYSRTILSAVIDSVNAVAANSLEMIGLNYGYDYAKNKFGLSTLVDEYVDANGVTHSDNAYAPLAMGAQTWGVSVRDMAGAYATFANDGIRRDERTFTKVYDSEGNLILDNTQNQEQILGEKAINYMNYCLVRATTGGTGHEADLRGMTVAGKTGSTSGFKDRWYCGFTGYYTAAIWTGFDEPEEIRGISGNPAAQLFKKVMAPLHEGKARIPLYDSSKFQTVRICLDSGLIATEACEHDARGLDRISTVVVYPEDRPRGTCDKHVTVTMCSGGGAPTEWCQKFAEIDETVEITEESCVILTEDEYNEAAKAVGKGLSKDYLDKEKMIIGDPDDTEELLKQEECPVHTQQAWEEYQASLLPEPDPTLPGVDIPGTGGNLGPAIG